MSTINATIKSVSVLASEYGNACYVNLNKEIDVIQKGNATTSKEFSINRKRLIAMICELDDDFATYRACQSETLNQMQLTLLLRGANVTIEVEHFDVGDVYTTEDGNDVAHDHEGYNYTIIDIKLSPKAIQRIDNACQL